MKAKSKKLTVIVSVILVAMLSVIGLSGCGSSSSSTDQASSTSADNGTVSGMVKSVDVDNNEITLSVMPNGGDAPEKPSGENGEEPSGDPPEKPSGDNGEAPSGNPPEKPDGTAQSGDSSDSSDDSSDDSSSKQQPPTGENGKAPEGNGDAPEMEETTYTITSDTVITDKDGNTLKLSKVTEGSFITLKGATEKK